MAQGGPDDSSYRGLRTDRRHEHRGPRGSQRLGGLALSAPIRLRRMLRRTARHRRSRFVGRRPSGEVWRRHAAIAPRRWCSRRSSNRGRAVRVTDCMPARQEHPRLERVVEGLPGSVTMSSRCVPRFDYGKTRPWIHGSGSAVTVGAGPEALEPRADAPLRILRDEDRRCASGRSGDPVPRSVRAMGLRYPLGVPPVVPTRETTPASATRSHAGRASASRTRPRSVGCRTSRGGTRSRSTSPRRCARRERRSRFRAAHDPPEPLPRKA